MTDDVVAFTKAGENFDAVAVIAGLGDHISVTGLDGEVVNIDLRYTVLQQPEKIVLIPNSNPFTNPIIVDGKPARGGMK
jgi:small-conductance mechanosensitive channel